MERISDKFKLLEVGRCEQCGGSLKDAGLGIYVCAKCGAETLSEFGMVKQFLNENGPSNAQVISDGTGVPVNKIERFLREGRIEIPEGSDSYISCEKCGVDIRYGRFCPACATTLSKELTSALTYSEVGEVPKEKGKMRYMEAKTEFRKDVKKVTNRNSKKER